MEIQKPKVIKTGFIYACMGFGGSEPDENSKELVKKCSSAVLEAAVPAAVYQVFEMGTIDPCEPEEYTDEDSTGTARIYIGNKKNILKGNAIAEHLRGCRSCVLMAVTLGIQVDRLIARTQIINMAEAVTMDACASSLTEDICDEINHKIENELGLKGLGLTSRFSPGYGDMPLESQGIFDRLLDMNRKIGLTKSREHLLLPRKSVTAIMGILPLNEIDKGYEKPVGARDSEEACRVCERKDNCNFRKKGGYCGSR